MTIFKHQISKYIREINNLSLWLNMNTDLCVFVDNSGHTEQIDVRIRESKKHYYKEIKTFGFYYSEDGKAYFDDINIEVRTAIEEAKACVKYLHKLIKDSKSNHVNIKTMAGVKQGNYLDGVGKDFCGFCKLKRTPEGHDGCIGEIESVKNACCGHGEDDCAYVQFDHDNYNEEPNKCSISGETATFFLNSIK